MKTINNLDCNDMVHIRNDQVLVKGRGQAVSKEKKQREGRSNFFFFANKVLPNFELFPHRKQIKQNLE